MNPDVKLRNPDHLASKFLGLRERAQLPDVPMDTLDHDFETALKRNPTPYMVQAMLSRTRYIFGFEGTGTTDFVRAEGLEVVEDFLTSSRRSLRYTQREDGNSPLPQPDEKILNNRRAW
jgi:hypothetical protein